MPKSGHIFLFEVSIFYPSFSKLRNGVSSNIKGFGSFETCEFDKKSPQFLKIDNWGDFRSQIESSKRVISCNLVYSGASERSRFLSVKNRLFPNVFKGFQVYSDIKNRLPNGSRNCCKFISLRTGTHVSPL